MNKEEVGQMLMIIRLKEFVARKSLDNEGHIGENEKMILSKLFANREYIEYMVRLNRELNRDEEEELYKSLLTGSDIQLRIYFSYLFKEQEENPVNCIKRMKFNMDEAFDVLVNFAGKFSDDEYSEKVKEHFFEKYGENLT
jgi:hypothetical protein